MNTRIIYSLIAAFLLLAACKKNDSQGRATLEIRLTDDPADYDEVNVDVRDVQINFSESESDGWKSLDGVSRGIYNLLDLVNEKSELLVNADIPAGRIEQIRLVLGNNNTIVVNGESHPMATPSALQSGLKLNIHQSVNAGLVYKMILDFDAGKSVVENGDGTYSLKPVIRTVMEAVGGSIRGSVIPKEEKSFISLFNGTNVIATTYTDSTGGFWFGGINAGTYSLSINPDSEAYKDAVKENVVVMDQQVNVLEPVTLETP